MSTFLHASMLAVLLAAPATGEQVNLLSLHEGALPVVVPAHYSDWSPEALLDDSPASGWACAEGTTTGNVFVFELAAEATLERFEFDTASIDEEGAGAREVVVEVSAISPSQGFTPVLHASLAAKADRQSFPAGSRPSARWVRLTIRSNHGNPSWTELFSFRGFGARADAASMPPVSGTYETSYSTFHVRQQGTALAGCYEYNEGLLTGAIEGRVMKLTWREGDSEGPAVMVFAPDGSSFRGFWWQAGNERKGPDGSWDGKKVSNTVGGCPHWSGSVGGELQRSLAGSGRARVYGINFDLDSATIRPESRIVLDEVVALLAAQPSWKLAVEGHTDSTGTDARNLTLSQQRAAAVVAYLTGRGVDSSRLRSAGFGAALPVADNATELGRARNRRVELVRE